MRKILFILTIIGVFVSGCGSNQTAEELFSGAENARNEKDIKGAISNLDLLLKKYPDHVFSILRLLLADPLEVPEYLKDHSLAHP